MPLHHTYWLFDVVFTLTALFGEIPLPISSLVNPFRQCLLKSELGKGSFIWELLLELHQSLTSYDGRISPLTQDYLYA